MNILYQYTQFLLFLCLLRQSYFIRLEQCPLGNESGLINRILFLFFLKVKRFHGIFRLLGSTQFFLLQEDFEEMPRQFDTSRIYELPMLKHNIAAVELIYSSTLGGELSESFTQKAIEHNKSLSKLSNSPLISFYAVVILDNIPVGCIYSHIEHKTNKLFGDKKTLVIDFICVLKSYQKHGVGMILF